jgi:phosphoribosylglycinamide formyltransferase-1
MSAGAPLRLGCLVSGGGRHVMNLQDCIARGELPATIAVVLATKPDAPAIDLCRARGLPVVVVPPQPPETVDDRVDDALRAANVELVVLAG